MVSLHFPFLRRLMHNDPDKSKIQIFFREKKINKSGFLNYIDNFILYEKKYFV